MASTGSYFRRYEGYLPKIEDIIGKLRAGSASTYGTAARKAGAAFGGSAGGYSSMMGDIWSQRAGMLGEQEAGLLEGDRETKLKLLRLAIQKAMADKQSGLDNLAGLGGALGSILGFAGGQMSANKLAQAIASLKNNGDGGGWI